MFYKSGYQLSALGIMWKKYYSWARPVGQKYVLTKYQRRFLGNIILEGLEYSSSSSSSNNNSMA